MRRKLDNKNKTFYEIVANFYFLRYFNKLTVSEKEKTFCK